MTDFLASHLGDLLARQPLPQNQSSTKEHHSQVNVNPSSSKKPERIRALTSSFSTDFGGSKPRYSPGFEYLASPVSPGSQKSSFSVGRGASFSSSPSPQNKSGTFEFFSEGKEDGRGQKVGRRDPSTSTTTSSSSSPLQLLSSPPTTSGSKSPVNEGRNASEKISQSHQRRDSDNSTPATSAPVKKQTSQGPSPRFTSMSSPAYNPPQHGKVIFNSPKSLQTRPSQSSSSSVVSSQTNRFRLVPCGSDGRSFRFVTEDEAEDQGQIRRNEVRISELMSSSSGSQVGGGIRRAGTVAASSYSSSQGTVEASIKEPSVQQILVSIPILVKSSPIEESNRTQLLQPPARSNSSTGGSKVENLSPFAPTSDIKASFEVLTDASQLDDGHSSSGVSMLEAATEALQSNQPQALKEARTFVFQSGKLVNSRRGSQNSDPSPSNSFSHQTGDRPNGFKRSALLEEFALDTSEGLGSFDATRPTLHVHRGRSSRRNSNNATSQSPRPHAQVKQSTGVVPADSERTPTSMPPRDVKTWVSGVSKLDSSFAPSMRNESVKGMSQDQVDELQETFNTLDVNENGEPAWFEPSPPSSEDVEATGSVSPTSEDEIKAEASDSQSSTDYKTSSSSLLNEGSLKRRASTAAMTNYATTHYQSDFNSSASDADLKNKKHGNIGETCQGQFRARGMHRDESSSSSSSDSPQKLKLPISLRSNLASGNSRKDLTVRASEFQSRPLLSTYGARPSYNESEESSHETQESKYRIRRPVMSRLDVKVDVFNKVSRTSKSP